jgi:hypothetical protein
LAGKGAKWMPTRSSAGNNFTKDDRVLKVLHDFLIKKVDKNGEVDKNGIGVEEIEAAHLPSLIQKNSGFMTSVTDEWLIKFYNYLENDQYNLLRGKDFAATDFIKTSTGVFTVPSKVYKRLDKDNKDLEAFPFVDKFIEENCSDFIKALDIKKPDEYDDFIKRLKSVFQTQKPENVNEAENIEFVSKAIKYLKENRPGIQDELKEYLRLKCIKSDGTNNRWTSYRSSQIYFKTDTNGVSLYDYFIGIDRTVFILDEEFYINAGIKLTELKELRNIGVKDTIYNYGQTEWDGSGRSICSNVGDFRRNLDFDYSNEVLNSISGLSDAAYMKSAVLFKFLYNIEKHLKGQYKNRQINPEFIDDTSEIVQKLNRRKWLFTSSKELVKSNDISRYDLALDIYGQVIEGTNIYNILGFKINETDNYQKILKDFAEIPENVRNDLIKHLIDQISIPEEEEEFDPDIDVNERTFPEENINDIARLKEQTETNYQKAPEVKYEPVVRRIRTTRGDDRAHLRNRYEGFCQICETPNKFWEVAEIFNKPRREMEEMNLSLCPNCASLYKYFRNDRGLMVSFADKLRHVQVDKETSVPINSSCHIRFTRAHLAEIQVILNLDKNLPLQDDGEVI